MPLYLHFIAFDFMHMAEFSRGRIDTMHLVPKRCRVVQHTPYTQHVFFTLFHHDSRVARAFNRNLVAQSLPLLLAPYFLQYPKGSSHLLPSAFLLLQRFLSLPSFVFLSRFLLIKPGARSVIFELFAGFESKILMMTPDTNFCRLQPLRSGH